MASLELPRSARLGTLKGVDFLPSKTPSGEIAINSEVSLFMLYDERGNSYSDTVTAVCSHLTSGEIVVGDFLTTYGIMFLTPARERVKLAKQENDNKPVSVVARLDDSLDWIDWNQIHPEFGEKEVRKLGNALTNLGFLRFPANSEGHTISPYAIDKGQLQILFKNSQDPILAGLREQNPTQKSYLVTSLNPHGQIERYQPHLAFKFAEDINAAAFVMQNDHFASSLQTEMYTDTRLKKGSVPIIQLPRTEDVNPYTGAPIITIARAANTHAYSVERMLKELFPFAGVRYIPDKPENLERPQYSLPHEARKDLREILYKASFPNR